MRQRVCQLCARLNWEQEHVQVQGKQRKWFLTINTIPVQDRIAVTIASNESFGHILSMERKLGVIVTDEERTKKASHLALP